MNIFEDLCRQYTQNRIDFKKVNRKIKNLFPDFDDYPITDEHAKEIDIDLNQYRIDFLNSGENWNGWVYLLEFYGGDEYTDREMQLAILLDEKKRLKQQAGMIKRRIYLNGKRLIK